MRRLIRLKEFPPSSVIGHTPPEWYVRGKDSTLEPRECLIRTDEHGFVLSGASPTKSDHHLIIMGDSVVEGMFVPEEARFCAWVEKLFNADSATPIRVLNSGYSGATTLHLYNIFVNKVIPLRPVAVILMSGIVDADVAIRCADYWTQDCWLEPIVDVDAKNDIRDQLFRSAPDYSSREKLLSIFQLASQLFDIPFFLATIPHRHIFAGEYVAKTYRDREPFDAEVASHRLVNACTRNFALENSIPLFDLESRLIAAQDIFYDMFHLNSKGGEVVARHLLDGGLREAVAERLR